MPSFASISSNHTAADNKTRLAGTDLRPDWSLYCSQVQSSKRNAHDSIRERPVNGNWLSDETILPPSYSSLGDQRSPQGIQPRRSHSWIVYHYSPEPIEAVDESYFGFEIGISADHTAQGEQTSTEMESPRPRSNRPPEARTCSIYEALFGCRSSPSELGELMAEPTASATPSVNIGPPAIPPFGSTYYDSHRFQSPMVSSSEAYWAAVGGRFGVSVANEYQARYLSLSGEQSPSSTAVGEDWNFVERLERDGVVEMKQAKYKAGMKGFLKLL
ncbi:MAG: hypothetical protein Q9216_004449 [Gyalolechia sp. 2 TL-2023]